MKLLRRVISALAMAGIGAAALRVRGRGGTPPQHGGWRPLEIAPDREPEVPADGPLRAR